MSDTHKDTIFAHEAALVDFVFDDKVVAVFPDMINRSVPGYATIVAMIGMLAERYAQPDSTCYDLGCSLGAAALAMEQHINVPNCDILAVDNSAAMVARCLEILNQKSDMNSTDDGENPMRVVCSDLHDIEINNASIVVMNFTLQFIALERRTELIKRIYQGLLPGGMLILSEKIRFEDKDLDSLFIDMHHRFKEQNGYSQLEISRKRAAIENVLIPETIAVHEKRIINAGFSSVDVWFQCFNFASMVAVKN